MIMPLLTNILSKPEHIMQVYDRKYAHFLGVNKNNDDIIDDYDPSHYLDNNDYYNDTTRDHSSAKYRNKSNRRASFPSQKSGDGSPDEACRNAAVIAAAHYNNMSDGDSAIQPPVVASFMSNFGENLLRSVKSTFHGSHKKKIFPLPTQTVDEEDDGNNFSVNIPGYSSEGANSPVRSPVVPILESPRQEGVMSSIGNAIKNAFSPRSSPRTEA